MSPYAKRDVKSPNLKAEKWFRVDELQKKCVNKLKKYSRFRAAAFSPMIDSFTSVGKSSSLELIHKRLRKRLLDLLYCRWNNTVRRKDTMKAR